MQPPRRILIAADKFKGSLDAHEACVAIARGMRRRFPLAEIECHPIADGGEGFATQAAACLDGRWIEMEVPDALGRTVSARYYLTDKLAVIEMAEASGIWRIPPQERDILRSSTFGTGRLIRHAAVENAAERILIGIGGSATNDGGAGMAAALGVRFLDREGHVLDPHPACLAGRLHAIDTTNLIPLPPVTAACDVTNVLLGNEGATRVFGPQKGADEASISLLEEMLADLVRISCGETAAARPGSGAAGGLGFGLVHFAKAELVPGFDLLASLSGLEVRIERADLIITGEGSLDAQSLAGKGPVALAQLARRHGKPVIACCGRATREVWASGLFREVHELASSGLPLETLLSQAAILLERAAASEP